MALVKCSHCGQFISDSAMQCPHCQNQFISAVQRNRIKKCSLIAMWLTIVGTIGNIIYNCYLLIGRYYSLFCDWIPASFSDDFIRGVFLRVACISLLCIALAWLFWFVREIGHKYPAMLVGIVISVLLVCMRLLVVITQRILFYHIALILSFALGITLFFLKVQGKIKVLCNTVGILYVVFYFETILTIVDTFYYELIGQSAMASMSYAIIHALFQLGTYIATSVLFYNTYKQAKIE